MKLAIVTDGIYPYVIGGMQKHSYYLAKFLVRSGVDVTLVHCVATGTDLPSEADVRVSMELSASDSFKSYCLHFPAPGKMPGHYLKESYAYSVKAFAVLQDQIDQFDFIYIKGFAGWDIINRKRKGQPMPPLGVKFHGYEMFQQAPSFRVKLEHWMLRGPTKFNNRNADVVLSYGGYITPLVEGLGIGRERIIEVPTGIEASWAAAKVSEASEKRRLLFIGRFERRKGVQELTAVLERLVNELDFEFHFVGPIPASNHIKNDRVIYHGKVMEKERMQAIIDSCQVLVTPSHSEGMPNVIMEGMARGLAVIATDVGAVPDQVDEANGWRLKPGDEAALERAVREAITMQPEQLQAKRRNSRQRVLDKFTWEQVAEQTKAALSQWLNRNRK